MQSGSTGSDRHVGQCQVWGTECHELQHTQNNNSEIKRAMKHIAIECEYSFAAGHAILLIVGALHAGILCCNICQSGARGSLVVKAICYKPDGRGFDNR
jgi:hypothetical protein